MPEPSHLLGRSYRHREGTTWQADDEDYETPEDALWAAKRREARSFPEPARSAQLKLIDDKQYGVRSPRHTPHMEVVDERVVDAD